MRCGGDILNRKKRSFIVLLVCVCIVLTGCGWFNKEKAPEENVVKTEEPEMVVEELQEESDEESEEKSVEEETVEEGAKETNSNKKDYGTASSKNKGTNKKHPNKDITSKDEKKEDTKKEDVPEKEEPLDQKKRPGILEDAAALDEKGVLSYIPNTVIEENVMQGLYLLQDNLLLCRTGYDFEKQSGYTSMQLISLESGEITKQTTLYGDSSGTIQIFGDKVVVSSAQLQEIYIYNADLELADSYPGKGDSIFVNEAITKAYCISWGEGVVVMDLETGAESVLFPDAYDVMMGDMNENSVVFSYVDAVTGFSQMAAVDLRTDQIKKIDLGATLSSVSMSENLWTGSIMGEEGYLFFGTQSNPYKFKTEHRAQFTRMLSNPTKLTLQSYNTDGSYSLNLYDEEGEFLSRAAINEYGGGPWTNPVWVEEANGYFMLIADPQGEDQLFFWDLSVKVSGEDLALVDFYYQETVDKVLPQEYYDRAEVLAEKHDVTIKIGEQCNTEFGFANTEQVFDEGAVTKGLDVLETALGAYPENFFGQLYFGEYRKIEINLTGNLTYNGGIDEYNPVAFVEYGEGVINIVLNVYVGALDLEQTFYHETSHIIDGKLAHHAKYNEDAVYSDEKWKKLNPDSFEYYGSYGDLPEQYYDNAYTPYFIDFYSMSYSKEDRGRILEYAMMGHTYAFDPEMFYGRLEKLKYYSECIRDAFDTTGWPEQTKWEYAIEHAGEGFNPGGKG